MPRNRRDGGLSKTSGCRARAHRRAGAIGAGEIAFIAASAFFALGVPRW